MKENSVFKQLSRLVYLPVYTRLVVGALELDVFSRLSSPITAKALSDGAGWDRHGTEVLLNALYSIGFVDKQDDGYVNTEEADRYLRASSPDYAGAYLLTYLRQAVTSLDVARIVREGPAPAETGQADRSLDFTQYGESFRAAQRGCRQQEVLRIVRGLPGNRGIRKVLDLGCNTGLLGLAVIADDPRREGVLFDMPQLLPVIEESIDQAGLRGRVRAAGGDFLTDDLGSGYDLILAVSVMVYARADMPAFLTRLHGALAPGGVAVCIGEGISPDFSGPWDMVMGYLPYWFQGLDMGVRSGEIEAAAASAGFKDHETRTEVLCSGTQDIVILRK